MSVLETVAQILSRLGSSLQAVLMKVIKVQSGGFQCRNSFIPLVPMKETAFF